MLSRVKSIFSFREHKRQLLHIVLVSFLISFASARAWALVIGNAIYFKGYHIHHFFFGTMALAIGGLMGTLSEDKKALRAASLLMGVGMGLFADEIGLLLNCTTTNKICAYAFPDTTDIIGAIVIFIFLLFVTVDILEKRAEKKRVQNAN
ncbi:MAG: hypothetical protein PHF11_07855 [Candidatus Omnitrophica bacterium]|nr:hypothetical protein [Candidatus Omnitrophota bacterium]